MKFNSKALTMVLSLSLTQIAFAEQNTLVYKNTRGSILELNFEKPDQLTGTFTTAVSTKECPDVIGVARPVIGYINGTAIAFTVNYPTCGSVVTLTGHINSSKNRIETTAIIAHQMSSFKEGPGATFITHDIFKKNRT